MVRVTVKDSQQTISFLAGEDTVRRLTAGCSVSPSSVEALLVATDLYERGISARVMLALMNFDKTLLREGAASIHQAIRSAAEQGQPLDLAFEVIDEATERAALERRGCEVVVFDLTDHVIRVSGAVPILASDEIRIHDGNETTNRTVTYILPQGWTIQPL